MKRKCSRCHAIEDESPPPTCEGGIPILSYQFHDWDAVEFVMSETTQVPATVSERDEAMFEQWDSQRKNVHKARGCFDDGCIEPCRREAFLAALAIQRARVASIVEKIEGLYVYDHSEHDSSECSHWQRQINADDVLELLKELRND